MLTRAIQLTAGKIQTTHTQSHTHRAYPSL